MKESIKLNSKSYISYVKDIIHIVSYETRITLNINEIKCIEVSQNEFHLILKS